MTKSLDITGQKNAYELNVQQSKMYILQSD